MKVKLKNIALNIIFLVLIFHGVWEEYSGIFKYVDELSSICIGCWGIVVWIYSNKLKIHNRSIFIIGCFLCFNIMGWISSFASNYRGFKILLLSSFLTNKFFFMMIGWLLLIKCGHVKYICELKKSIRPMLYCITVWQVIAVVTGAIPTFSEVNLCAKSTLLCALIFMTWNKKSDLINVALVILLLLSTHKAKAAGAIVIILSLGVWCLYLKKEIKLAEIVLGAAGIFLVAREKIIYYFIYGLQAEFPRIMLMKYGSIIASERFPLGTGWGTFGSYYAASMYSPIYEELGWSSHHSLGMDKIGYLNDTFWPTIYCETGWIGMIGFVIMLLAIFVSIQKMYKKSFMIYAAGILSYVYILITTLESTAYSHPALLLHSFVFSITIYMSELPKEEL